MGKSHLYARSLPCRLQFGVGAKYSLPVTLLLLWDIVPEVTSKWELKAAMGSTFNS